MLCGMGSSSMEVLIHQRETVRDNGKGGSRDLVRCWVRLRMSARLWWSSTFPDIVDIRAHRKHKKLRASKKQIVACCRHHQGDSQRDPRDRSAHCELGATWTNQKQNVLGISAQGTFLVLRLCTSVLKQKSSSPHQVLLRQCKPSAASERKLAASHTGLWLHNHL